MLGPWWERYPGRLEWELAELDAAGIAYTIDEVARAAGIILRVEMEVDGEPLQLVVVFPDLYPDFRFEVHAPGLDLDHHQNPFNKNLCMIGRDTANWLPEDTLASYLQHRLPLVLRSGRSDDPAEVRGVEEQQAEPFSDYYRYRAPANVMIDSSWSLDLDVDGGALVIGIDEERPAVRGAVLEVYAESGELLASADDAFIQRYAHKRKIKGRWVRCPAAIRQENEKAFLQELGAYDKRLVRAKWQRTDSEHHDIVGVVFPEEVGWRASADGWVFLVRAQQSMGSPDYYFARAGRAGRSDLSARVPDLASLADRRIAVIGLGALGMPSAIEFARAGVGELRVLDGDVVDPGITVRWPLGLGSAGLSKTVALKRFLNSDYPYTKVVDYDHWLGRVRYAGESSSEPTDLSILSEMLDGVDLVYDATAEEGVHYFLDRLCREWKIPYICVSATNGAWGGRVVRILPTADMGCWSCLLAAGADGTIPWPAADPSEPIQPAGCASPTFTGTGFDLAQVNLMAVRLAISTLVDCGTDGNRNMGWDVAIGALRDANGCPTVPRWGTYPLERHPRCPICSSR